MRSFEHSDSNAEYLRIHGSGFGQYSSSSWLDVLGECSFMIGTMTSRMVKRSTFTPENGTTNTIKEWSIWLIGSDVHVYVNISCQKASYF